MKASVLIAAGLLSIAANAIPAQDKTQSQDPIVWGISSGNSSCVIFAEGRKTSMKFYGIAATSKTVGKLTLIETQNYTFDQKETLETQENMNNLMRIAQKDHVKFVKIPEKYSPDLLEKARAACKPDPQPN